MEPPRVIRVLFAMHAFAFDAFNEFIQSIRTKGSAFVYRRKKAEPNINKLGWIKLSVI
jgi:hypothetical protein